MNDETCANCGKSRRQHLGSALLCPGRLEISADADTIERFVRTGHPRSVGVLFGEPTKPAPSSLGGGSKRAFTNVSVTALSISGANGGTDGRTSGRTEILRPAK